MLVYLSLDTICSSKLTVRSRKTVRFSERYLKCPRTTVRAYFLGGGYSLYIYMLWIYKPAPRVWNFSVDMNFLQG